MVVDDSEVQLVGLSQVTKISAKSKEVLREDVWALTKQIEFKARTPKSDMVMLAKFLLQDQYNEE
jgi:hypothetical protein